MGEKTLAQRLYPRLRADELLTADRGFYSWQGWDAAAATGAALLWRAPTQLGLPVVRVLLDGTYLTALITPTTAGAAASACSPPPARLAEVGFFGYGSLGQAGTGIHTWLRSRAFEIVGSG